MTELTISTDDQMVEESFKCDKCQDRGIWFDSANRAHPCQCQAAERFWRSAARMAGIPEVWWSLTLERFEPEDEVQFHIISILQQLVPLVRRRRNTPRPVRGLLLYGATGPGKSCMLAAFANTLIRQGLSVDWRNVPGLYFDALASQKEEGGVSRLLQTLAEPDLLVLDDLGAQKASEFGESIIYSALNDRIESGKMLVASSNLDPEELAAQIGERNASRLAGLCIAAPVPGEDRRANPPKGLLNE